MWQQKRCLHFLKRICEDKIQQEKRGLVHWGESFLQEERI